MDHETFFGFRTRPFGNARDPRFHFARECFGGLVDLLSGERIPGILELRGEKGTGKTSALLALADALPPRGTVAVPVIRGGVTLSGILREILLFLGPSERCPPGAPEETLLGFFQNAVSERVMAGQKIVLAVDGANLLKAETLLDLAALPGLERFWAGRAGLLLAGEGERFFPEGGVPPGRERIQIPWGPLSESETRDYIRHRTKQAGVSKDLFTREAKAAIFKYSKGFPEAANRLCDRALMAAWARRGKEAGPKDVRTAAESLRGPREARNDRDAKDPGNEERGNRPRKDGNGARRPKTGYLWHGSVLVLLALLIALFFFKGASVGGASKEAPPAVPPELGILAGEAAIPAAAPALPEEVSAPALPTPPGTLLNLPRNSLALVAEGTRKPARLWQGGTRGPGLKAEMTPPDIKEPGLYLVGRPRGRTPLMFRYPPTPDIPREEGAKLWKRVESQLPQDMLPLMVGDESDFKAGNPEILGTAIKEKLKSWAKAQEYKFADSMALLYAEKFRFFEPGHPDRTIDRENFRQALAAEFKASGDVKVTMSEPLVMLDPANHQRAWAVFNLKYDSKLRRDSGLRTLIFEKPGRNRDWIIVAELWIKERAPGDVKSP
ncbi:MAG: AAA family ATPase [Deltaproteobacteria bacterium]|jgi:general secretion pathway protein A|nr:AAA family ATPase [Deltaproteobacteria bacterium]